jgi:CRISPR system Cascade subunit CasD
MAFGGVAVDAFGVIDDLPSASLIVGLLGNALGYRRTEIGKLQQLQNRLQYAVRIDRPGQRVTDYQTAELHKDDKGWTTYGTPEGRSGAPSTYSGQYQRFQDFHADAAITIALVLDPQNTAPVIDDLARALDAPARPLFIGRKPCLPSDRLLLGVVEAETLENALAKADLAVDTESILRCFRPATAIDMEGVRMMHGRRNWQSNVHQGAQPWVEYFLEATS